MSIIIDGRALAEEIKQSLKLEIIELKSQQVIPELVVIVIGDNPASQVYVKNKHLAAESIGIRSIVEKMPLTTTEDELLERIQYYNERPQCHGILVQLPLPKHINSEKVVEMIVPEKDVDGFHPYNVGRLSIGKPLMLPCTPAGIMEMLEAYSIPIEGKKAVIIGRSNIVGKPMASLLLSKNATVTITHSKTPNLSKVAKEADILIAAIGKGHFVDKSFIKPGATVIDVGMNRNADGKLIGDVKFEEVRDIADYITPVPKGVGPMTIAMLLKQTVANAKRTYAD